MGGAGPHRFNFRNPVLPHIKNLNSRYSIIYLQRRSTESHHCHRLRAQKCKPAGPRHCLHAQPTRLISTTTTTFDPIRPSSGWNIISWNIVCCCNKSELKLIITLSSYRIICRSNPIVAIAVYRPYHQMASSVSTMAYHPHHIHIVGGFGCY